VTLQSGLVLARKTRQSCQVFDDSRLKLFLEQREELASNAGAHSFDVAIGDVFAPILFLAAEISSQIGSANGQEGAHYGAGNRMNPAEAGEAGPAQEMGEHRFGLVVRGVSNRDACASARLGKRAKVVVAGAARGIL
jgi:hypothetical protein